MYHSSSSHLSRPELEATLTDIRNSPTKIGVLKLIVGRPAEDTRKVLTEGTLDPQVGLVGDTWSQRPSRHRADNSPNPLAQLTLMNWRFATLIAQRDDRIPLAGDQLYVDMDLSADNLPPGTRLAIGAAIVEITDQPHTGCAKFSARFGVEAHKFVNSPEGKSLRLRGANARVIVGGIIKPGDTVTVIPVREENPTP
jgi:hypothetical protein